MPCRALQTTVSSPAKVKEITGQDEPAGKSLVTVKQEKQVELLDQHDNQVDLNTQRQLHGSKVQQVCLHVQSELLDSPTRTEHRMEAGRIVWTGRCSGINRKTGTPSTVTSPVGGNLNPGAFVFWPGTSHAWRHRKDSLRRQPQESHETTPWEEYLAQFGLLVEAND